MMIFTISFKQISVRGLGWPVLLPDFNVKYSFVKLNDNNSLFNENVSNKENKENIFSPILNDSDGNRYSPDTVRANLSPHSERILKSFKTGTHDRLSRLSSIIQNNSSYQLIQPLELYKLFIDGDRWVDAKKTYTEERRFDIREPGYINGMLDAACFLFEKVNDNSFKLTADFINKLHSTAVNDVEDVKDGPLRKDFRSRLPGDPNKVAFGLISEKLRSDFSEHTSSVDGRAEFKEFWTSFNKRHKAADGLGILDDYFKLQGDPDIILTDKEREIFQESNNDTHRIPSPTELINSKTFQTLSQATESRSRIYHFSEKHELVCQPLTKDLASTVINILISEFYQTIDSSPVISLDDKLSAIANLCQRLDQLHPFCDGNIRVFGILLCQFLCMKYGFGIPAFKDPNVFDMRSNAELVSLIKSALKTTAILFKGSEIQVGSPPRIRKACYQLPTGVTPPRPLPER